jgi:hypothetical protein
MRDWSLSIVLRSFGDISFVVCFEVILQETTEDDDERLKWMKWWSWSLHVERFKVCQLSLSSQLPCHYRQSRPLNTHLPTHHPRDNIWVNSLIQSSTLKKDVFWRGNSINKLIIHSNRSYPTKSPHRRMYVQINPLQNRPRRMSRTNAHVNVHPILLQTNNQMPLRRLSSSNFFRI